MQKQVKLMLCYLIVIWCSGLVSADTGPTMTLPEPIAKMIKQSPGQPLFEEVWKTFDQHYSYFTYKKIDWQSVKTQALPKFNADLTADEFAERLNEQLKILDDWHVTVKKLDGEALGLGAEYPTNFTSEPRNRYCPKGYQRLGNVAWYGTLTDNIGYLRVDSITTKDYANITDDAIEAMFAQFQSTRGLILDIRPNNGGNEEIAAKFASHFTEKTVTYGFTRTRNGANHDDFDPMESKELKPAQANLYKNPVICLIGQRCMSSAEWFALMMRASGAKLIGDRTRGASGKPKEFELPNGIKYELSTWIAYDMKKREFENRGIQPDVKIEPSASFNGEHDFVLERALEALQDVGPSKHTSDDDSELSDDSDPLGDDFDPFDEDSEPAIE